MISDMMNDKMHEHYENLAKERFMSLSVESNFMVVE